VPDIELGGIFGINDRARKDGHNGADIHALLGAWIVGSQVAPREFVTPITFQWATGNALVNRRHNSVNLKTMEVEISHGEKTPGSLSLL
jgi:hypothetical protein